MTALESASVPESAQQPVNPSDITSDNITKMRAAFIERRGNQRIDSLQMEFYQRLDEMAFACLEHPRAAIDLIKGGVQFKNILIVWPSAIEDIKNYGSMPRPNGESLSEIIQLYTKKPNGNDYKELIRTIKKQQDALARAVHNRGSFFNRIFPNPGRPR